MAGLVGARICHIRLSSDLQSSQLPLFVLKHSCGGHLNLSFSILRQHKSLIVAASSIQPPSTMSATHFDNTLPSREVLEIWRNADAVCFDVDSTVCLDEGIDELADFCGAGKAVAEWTSKAMSGSVPFEDALTARLSLFNPSLSQLQDFLEKRPPRESCPFGARSISTQIVRNRMKSVKNIQKITKAMKMVAASKLRAVQIRTEKSRGLWQPFTALLGDAPSVDVKKNVIITISSDKGLCGGINSTSVKVSKSLFKLTSGPEKETKYVILGEKGKVQLIRDSKNRIELTITELQKNPLNYTQVSVLADDILKNVEYDALRIVFNKFQSVVQFFPTVSTILSPEVVERESETGGKLGELDLYEIEGGETKAEVLQNLTEFQFSCTMFNAVLENACSELGARMSAMDSSSRNAGEMLDRLTLTYNRTRQASITTELTEIISGASALTG